MSPLRTGLCAAVLLGLAASASAQSIIYRETFSQTVNNSTLNSVGWQAYTTATVGANVADTTFSSGFVSNGTGRPANLDPINAGTYGQQPLGIAYLDSGSRQEALLFTTEYTWNWNPVTTAGDIKWFSGNQFANIPQRAALQIGSQWYVSAERIGPNVGGAGNFATFASEVAPVSLAGTSWFALTATIGAPFSISGTAVSLPTGLVSGMGIYTNVTGSGQNSRFDNFTVTTTAIPEPSSFAALAGLGALGLVALRRRRLA